MIILPNRRKAFSSSFITLGLVGFWTFDLGKYGSGTNEVIDSSSYLNNGSQNGGVITSAGHNGNAAVFDSSSKFINIPNSSSLNTNGAYTLLAWVYPTAITTYGGIVVKGNSSPPLSQYELAHDSLGRLYFQSGSFNSFSGNTALSTNIWQHVAIRISSHLAGGTAEMYFNGLFDKTKTLGGNLLQNTTSVGIGRYDASFPFKGLIDDVRVYNRYLTANEILLIATNLG